VKSEPALTLIAKVMVTLKKRGPMNTHDLADHYGRSAGSMGGILRIAAQYKFCAHVDTVRIPGKAYSRVWRWVSDIPADFDPPPIFKSRYMNTPKSAVTNEERRRKNEIAQDHDRWFAELQAEMAAKCQQRQQRAAA